MTAATGIESLLGKRIDVLDDGFVTLVDCMGDDAAIVQAARVSYGAGTKQIREDRTLIRYLMRHRHTTPFEMVEFKFHVAMPIFVARQWIRHRTANVNEYSGRYSVMPDRFYRPAADALRRQSAENRQGGGAALDQLTAEEFLNYLEQAESTYGEYERLLEKGVSRELARIALPLSVYTEWYWKCDLHNILHFLSLRLAPDAQSEIREYAKAMYALTRPMVPTACEAFEDYTLHAVRLTRLEIEAVRTGKAVETSNARERAEWRAKAERLGLAAPDQP